MPPIPSFAAVAAALLLSLAGAPRAAAQPLPPAPPQNVVSLSASASTDVTKDLLQVVFSTAREGTDAAQVQSQLKQALDAALAEARRVARPGALEVQTGNFALHPRYAPPNPKGGSPGITGWQGQVELIVEGRDAEAIAQLAGRIQTLTIARTGFALSRESREKVEADVTAQAIARSRSRADAVAKQFGFASWSLREVQVGGSEPPPPYPVPMRMRSAAAMADEALPVEAGSATVSATVQGSVQLQR